MTTEARIITTPARAMIRRWPTLVVLAFVWIGLCIVAAALAPRLPVSYQTLDLRARLAPPVLFGGTWHYLHVANAIDSESYRPTRWVMVLTSFAVFVLGGTSLVWLLV